MIVNPYILQKIRKYHLINKYNFNDSIFIGRSAIGRSAHAISHFILIGKSAHA